jgi:hypothetical protein
MSIRSDLKSVFRELSPILAGFKLGLIVISYFGIGSVAKWVISHWYPFTRWVWDLFCEYFTLPTFPDVVKDSLTALLFFIPLGVTSLIEFRKKSDDENSTKHRFFGAFFGFLFLAFICNEALSAIATAVSESSAITSFDSVFLRFSESFLKGFNAVPVWVHVAFLGAYLASSGALAFYINKSEVRRNRFTRIIRQSTKLSFQLLSAISFLLLLISVGLPMTGLLYGGEIAVLVSIAIMLITFAILLAAVAFAPRKLFVTAGACIAFVVAAMCFEFVVWLIDFIEKAPQ